jgi:hypothetical protein
MNTILTVRQLAESQPALTEGGIRWQIFNKDFNGLAHSGALVRVGARVLIDPDKYLGWLRTNPRISPPGAKPGNAGYRPKPVSILEAEAAE